MTINSDLHFSKRGYALVRDFEGLFLQAYDDATDHIVRIGGRVHGTLTIGYGHTTAAGPPKVYVGMTLADEAEAETILQADLVPVEAKVKRLVTVRLNQNQYDALVDFEYNCGWLGHLHCSLLEAVNAGNAELVERDFMLYDRANGVVLAGLDRRRAAERALFHLTPEVISA
jgi:lysozyme